MLVIPRSINQEETLFLLKEIESFLLARSRPLSNSSNSNITSFIFKLQQNLKEDLNNVDLFGIYLEVARKISTNDLGGLFQRINAYSNFLSQQREKVDLLGTQVYNQILSEKEELNDIKFRIKRNLIALRSYRNTTQDFILNLQEQNSFYPTTKEPSLFISKSLNGTTLPVKNSKVVEVERITITEDSNGKLGDPENINSSTQHTELNNLLIDDDLSVLTYSRSQDNSVKLGLNYLLKSESVINGLEISAFNSPGSEFVKVEKIQTRKEGGVWKTINSDSFFIEDTLVYLFDPVKAIELRIFLKNQGSSSIEIREGVSVQRSLLPLKTIRPRLVTFSKEGTLLSKSIEVAGFKGLSSPLWKGKGINKNLFDLEVFVGESNEWVNLLSLEDDQDNIAFINDSFQVKVKVKRKSFKEVSNIKGELTAITGSIYSLIQQIRVMNNTLLLDNLDEEDIFIKPTSYKVGKKYELPRFNSSSEEGNARFSLPSSISIRKLTSNGVDVQYIHEGNEVTVQNIPVNSRVDIDVDYEYPLISLENNSFYIKPAFPFAPATTKLFLGNYNKGISEQFFAPRSSFVYLNNKFIKKDSIKVYENSSLINSSNWSFDPETSKIEINENAVSLDSIKRVTYEYVPQVIKQTTSLIKNNKLVIRVSESQLNIRNIQDKAAGLRDQGIQWTETGELGFRPEVNTVQLNGRTFLLSNQQVIKNTLKLRGFNESLQEVEFIDGSSEFTKNSTINALLSEASVSANIGIISSPLIDKIQADTITSNKDILFNQEVDNPSLLVSEGDWCIVGNQLRFYVPDDYNLLDAIVSFSIDFQNPNVLMYSVDYVNGAVFFAKEIVVGPAESDNKKFDYLCSKVMFQGEVYDYLDHSKADNKVIFPEEISSNFYHVKNDFIQEEDLGDLEQFYSPRLSELVLQSTII